MKAISVRQPWADLIVQGKKKMELRTWKVTYRGPLAIHASQTVEREECVAHGLDPDMITNGGFVGIVDLVDIVPLDEKTFRASKNEHLSPGGFNAPLFGWRLVNPRLLAHPQPGRGKMGLFNVPDELVHDERGFQMESHTRVSDQPTIFGDQAFTRPFELRVIPNVNHTGRESAYNLVLFQRIVEPPGAQKLLYEGAKLPVQHVAELGGNSLRAVADQVLDAIKRSGYRATDLQATRREPFRLDDESGVRLGLLFLAVKPVTKMDRVEAIAEGIRRMTSEEAYYWYSKSTAQKTAARAQKALRLLLAEE